MKLQLGFLTLCFLALPAFANAGFGIDPFFNPGQSSNYGLCMHACGVHPLYSAEYNRCFAGCTGLNGNGVMGYPGMGHGFHNGFGNPSASDTSTCSYHGGTHIVPASNVNPMAEPCPSSQGFSTVGILPSGSICCRHQSAASNSNNSGSTTNTSSNNNNSGNSNGSSASCNSNIALQCLNSGAPMFLCLQVSGCAG